VKSIAAFRLAAAVASVFTTAAIFAAVLSLAELAQPAPAPVKIAFAGAAK
jgi:hypothetical protein